MSDDLNIEEILAYSHIKSTADFKRGYSKKSSIDGRIGNDFSILETVR